MQRAQCREYHVICVWGTGVRRVTKQSSIIWLWRIDWLGLVCKFKNTTGVGKTTEFLVDLFDYPSPLLRTPPLPPTYLILLHLSTPFPPAQSTLFFKAYLLPDVYEDTSLHSETPNLTPNPGLFLTSSAFMSLFQARIGLKHIFQYLFNTKSEHKINHRKHNSCQTFKDNLLIHRTMFHIWQDPLFNRIYFFLFNLIK